ncbi:hypothetical protein H0H92_004045 [Tricholoma furcatifolium]|nr:hypothetical protein H0H92_004045 [Tricholoma furcatifolium]
MSKEILQEICAYLEPEDLLHLCRANKILRTTLLKRDKIIERLWKQAFSNLHEFRWFNDVSPPELPKGMSYPSYALLLFGNECQASSTMWFLSNNGCPELESWFATVPPVYQNHEERSAVGLSEEGVAVRITQLKDDKSSLDIFIATEQNNRYQETEDVEQLEEWFYPGQESIQSQRQKDIYNKLEEEGYWDSGKDSYQYLMGLREVDKTEPLTEQIWKNIKPGLIKSLKEERARRLARERKPVIQSRLRIFFSLCETYLSLQPNQCLLPTAADLLAEEPLKSLIFSTPVDVTITDADFDARKAKIPKACNSWLREKTKMLEALLPSEYPRLDLATALSSCRWCKDAIHYPQILKHRCLREPPFTIDASREPFNCFPQEIFQRPWNWQDSMVTFHDKAAQDVREIALTCGLDPSEATIEEMNGLDRRLECLRCTARKYKRIAMGWLGAILHEKDMHQQEQEQKWKGPRWKLIEVDETQFES